MNTIRVSAHLGALNLQIEADFSGEFIIISGENGAGKTTLLRCLSGLENMRGQVVVNETIWQDSSAGFWLLPEDRHTGCVWTNTALLPWLSVEKNVMLGLGKAENADKDRLRLLTEQLEITSLMQRKPHMLSAGEAQRVALARAIYRQPSMLLLDEPFSAQAPAIRQRLRLVLKAIQEDLGIPVLMVSHDIEDAKALGHQHWHMREGRLLTGIMHTQKELQA